MIFQNKKTIIFITRTKIRAAVFGRGDRSKKIISDGEWMRETLPAILKDISKRGPDLARVVFAEELAWVAAMNTGQKNRIQVREAAKEVIPDELKENWDFRLEKDPVFSSQVAAIGHDIFEFFMSSARSAGLKIEAVEPQSVALARLFPEKGLFLFIAKEDDILLGAVLNGTVVATYVAPDENAISTFERFLALVKNKCGSLPETVHLDLEINPNPDFFFAQNLKTERYELDPMKGMALKKDISGKDWRVLNIRSLDSSEANEHPQKISQTYDDSREKMEKSGSRTSAREKILAVVFIAMIFVAAATVVYMKYLKK